MLQGFFRFNKLYFLTVFALFMHSIGGKMRNTRGVITGLRAFLQNIALFVIIINNLCIVRRIILVWRKAVSANKYLGR